MDIFAFAMPQGEPAAGMTEPAVKLVVSNGEGTMMRLLPRADAQRLRDVLDRELQAFHVGETFTGPIAGCGFPHRWQRPAELASVAAANDCGSEWASGGWCDGDLDTLGNGSFARGLGAAILITVVLGAGAWTSAVLAGWL